MNAKPSNLVLLVVALGTAGNAQAQLTVGSDGSDGVFNPTANVVVDLTQAVDATWDTPGTGNGVYDADKWAVVFKYQSVNIPAGVSVSFRNHRTRAPVVWLVQDHVTIDGELHLDGQRNDVTPTEPSEPGPGGFRGGILSPRSDGYGPAGGVIASDVRGYYAGAYGNAKVLPLLGGSGGAGRDGRGGAGGGGAILIAAANTINVEGLLTAMGGSAGGATDRTGGGAGGGIRLVALTVAGSGLVAAAGQGSGAGGSGFIRVEAHSISGTLGLSGSVTQDIPGDPVDIWPPAVSPSVRVASIDFIDASGVAQSMALPQDPQGRLDFPNADTAFLTDQPVSVNVEAQNVPLDWIVTIRILPKAGQAIVMTAPPLVGSNAASTTSVDVALVGGFSTIQARASAPN